MQLSSQDLNAIQEAFPHYTPADIQGMLKNPNTVKQVIKIIQKNRYTKDCMEEISGFHFSRMLDDDYQLLTIDFNKINPFYKTKLYRGDSTAYSLSNVLISHGYFQDIIHFIQYLSDNQFKPDQIRQILDIPSVCTDIRRYIIDSSDDKSLSSDPKEKIQQKIMFDSCMAEITKKIGFQELIEDVFNDKIKKPLQLEEDYLFESSSKTPLTIIDFCLNHHMPQTVKTAIQQIWEKTHNPQVLAALLQGKETRRYLQEAYQNRIHSQKKEPVAKSVADYLESILPTDLFIYIVTQKNISYQWKNDFDYQSNIPNPPLEQKQQEKSTTLAPKQSKSSRLIQSHFLDLLQDQLINR